MSSLHIINYINVFFLRIEHFLIKLTLHRHLFRNLLRRNDPKSNLKKEQFGLYCHLMHTTVLSIRNQYISKLLLSVYNILLMLQRGLLFFCRVIKLFASCLFAHKAFHIMKFVMFLYF